MRGIETNIHIYFYDFEYLDLYIEHFECLKCLPSLCNDVSIYLSQYSRLQNHACIKLLRSYFPVDYSCHIIPNYIISQWGLYPPLLKIILCSFHFHIEVNCSSLLCAGRFDCKVSWTIKVKAAPWVPTPSTAAGGWENTGKKYQGMDVIGWKDNSHLEWIKFYIGNQSP